MKNRIFILLWVFAAIVLPALSARAQTSWTTLQGPPQARDIKDIAVSNDGVTLYATDKSVLFKSTNSGSSWAATNEELVAPLVVLCKPDNPNIVVAGINGELRRNTVGGTGSWVLALGPSSLTPLRLAVSSISGQTDYMFLGRLASGTTSSIMRSSDAGATWIPPTTYPIGTNIHDFAPYPVSAGIRSDDIWTAGSDPAGASNETGDPNTTDATIRGVWQSTNQGLDWTEKNIGNFNIRAIAIANQVIPFIYAGTSTGKLYRSDEGAGWTLFSGYQTASGATTIRAIRVRTDNNYVLVASDQGIHRSTNSGNNWSDFTPNSTDKSILALSIARDNQNLMFATTNKAVYKSTDGGSTWTEVGNGLGRMPISSVAVNGSSIWTTSSVYDTLGFYNGTAWSILDVPAFYGEHITRNSSNGHLFASGRVNPANPKATYYRSTNGGISYGSLYTSSTAGSGNAFRGSMVDPVNSAYTYVWGKDGTTNLYHDHGDGTRDPFTVGSFSYAVNDMIYATSSGPFYYAKDNEGVFRCLTEPCTGTQILSGTTARSLALNATVSTSTVWAATSSGLLRYNGGVSFPAWPTQKSGDFKRVIMRPGHPTSADHVAALTNDGNAIFYTADGGITGSTWVDGTLDLPKPVYAISTEPGNTNTVFAATDQGAFKLTTPTQLPTLYTPTDQALGQPINVTLTWNGMPGASAYHVMVDDNSNFSTPNFNRPTVASTSFTTAGLAYYTTYYWKVYANNIAGEGPASSTRSFTTQPGISLTWLPITSCGDARPNLSWSYSGPAYSGTWDVWRYPCPASGGDCGATPTRIAQGLTATSMIDCNVSVAQKGEPIQQRFYYYVTGNNLTSNKVVINSDGINKETVAENTPRENRLQSNYPNPFNPLTTIKYDLAANVHVSLRVYDVLGREVATLVDAEQEAGYKSVEFDAAHLPSGVYFYRLQAGKYSSIKKMMLLK